MRRGTPTWGHEARKRGTLPATTNAHGQVPSNNGRWVPQTQTARTTRNEPRHGNRCQATPNSRTTNPSQESGGTGGGRTPTHTPQHPSQEWRGAAESRAQAHTPTPHTPARSVGVQAEGTHQNTQPNTPARTGGAQPKSVLWFDLGTVSFLENPKIRQTSSAQYL